MTTLLLQHPAFLAHAAPLGYPERPDRVRVVDRILEHERFQDLAREGAPIGTAEMVMRVHPMTHYSFIEKLTPKQGLRSLDDDTTLSPGTFEAAMRAVGAATRAVDEVMEGKVRNAFCAIRPPGHHAETAKAMGFCFFNNAAVAARHAQAVHGAERVAIVDFDVHHGNGTQQIFWNDPSVLYASTHQMPLFPHTGELSETGVGNIFNAPLNAGDDGGHFQEAMETRILPALNNFRPDLIIISAGFDAHHRDPLGELKLTEADFAWVTRKLIEVADRSCNGRVVSVMEGGYDLEGLARSVAAHVMMLMNT